MRLNPRAVFWCLFLFVVIDALIVAAIVLLLNVNGVQDDRLDRIEHHLAPTMDPIR